MNYIWFKYSFRNITLFFYITSWGPAIDIKVWTSCGWLSATLSKESFSELASLQFRRIAAGHISLRKHQLGYPSLSLMFYLTALNRGIVGSPGCYTVMWPPKVCFRMKSVFTFINGIAHICSPVTEPMQLSGPAGGCSVSLNFIGAISL